MPMSTKPKINIFCWRLRQARSALGISQKSLGKAIGLDEFSAGTRINRYERGIHNPDPIMAGNIARALNIPLAFLYSESDETAKLVLGNSKEHQGLLELIEALPVPIFDNILVLDRIDYYFKLKQIET